MMPAPPMSSDAQASCATTNACWARDFPALREALSADSRSAGKSRAQQAFVVAQLACASLLMGGAGIMVATYVHVSQSRFGFDARPIVLVNPTAPGDPLRAKSAAELSAFAQTVRERLASISGVKSVAGWGVPSAIPVPQWGEGVSVTEDTPHGLRSLTAVDYALVVDPSFLSTMGIPVRAGRGFTSGDGPGAPPVVLIDEATAAHWWPGERA